MVALTFHTSPSSRFGHGHRTGTLESVAQMIARLSAAWRTRQAIRRAEELDDTMLHDIGLSRGAIENAVRHGQRRID